MIYKALTYVLAMLIGVVIGFQVEPREVIYKQLPSTIEYVDMDKVECMSEHKLIDPEKVICPKYYCNSKEEYHRGYEEGVSKFSTECLTK